MGDYEDFLNGLGAPAEGAPPAPTVPNPDLDATGSYEKFLQGLGGNQQTPVPYEQFVQNVGLEDEGVVGKMTRLFTSGVARNYGQFKAIIPTLQSMYNESQGDQVGAVEKAKEAQNILQGYGDSQYELFKNVHSPEDFGYWLIEKLGEQGITTLATMATAGGGALTTKLAMSQLLERGLISKGTAESAMLAGAAVPTYALSSAMEGANTSQEQFEVTGSPQAGLSATAGLTKGLLELWAPMSIARHMISPSTVVGTSALGALGKTALKEGSTEYAQELIDIAARKYSDPNYSFFGTGATPWYQGEGFLRAAESGATGFAVGAVYGAPFARAEAAAATREALGDQPIGDRRTFTAGQIPPEFQPGEPPPKGEISPELEKLYDQHTKLLQDIWNNDEVKNPARNKQLNQQLDQVEQKIREVENFQNRATHGGSGAINELSVPEGPITSLRNMVMAPQGFDAGNMEILNAFPKSPRDDVTGLGPLTASVRNDEMAREAILNHIDRTTLRYIEQKPDGSLGNRILTDTEIELHDSLYRTQDVKPSWVRVDPASLQAVGISAHVTDLADPKSGKVWFADMPGRPLSAQQKQQMMMQYEETYLMANATEHQILVDSATRAAFEKSIGDKYGPLLTMGLRVVPSRGAGFYYTAGVRTVGPAMDPGRLSKRSQENAWYQPSTGLLTPFRGDERQIPAGGSGILVSIDWNKAKPGDFTRMSNGDLLMKRTDLSKLTPGIRNVYDRKQEMIDRQSRPALEGQSAIQVMPDIKLENSVLVERMVKVIEKALPKIRQVLKSIGYTEPVPIILTDNGAQFGIHGTGAALTERGAVVLVPDNLAEQRALHGVRDDLLLNKDFDLHLLNLLGHEIGHLVTLRYFMQLPSAIQDGLTYAWQKANLAGRMRSYSKTNFTSYGNPHPLNRQYWATFPEWMAEQFRRWMTSDAQALTHIEVAQAGVARKLEAWVRTFNGGNISQAAITNLLYPDHFFSAFMEYMREYGKARKANSQLTLQQALLKPPGDLRHTPAAMSVANIVANQLENYARMIPPGVGLVLQPGALDPNVIKEYTGVEFNPSAATARWVYYPAKMMQFIEIALGTLNTANAEEESRLFIPHELMHAYEALGIIPDNAIAILMKDIKGKEDQIFPPDMAAQLRNSVRQEQKELKKDETWFQVTYKERYEKELRAYYIQDFADTGVAYSEEGRGVINWILQLIERIKNAVQGLGFQTREDVIRAFYSGEMLERFNNADKQRVVKQKAQLLNSIDQARRNEMVPNQVIEVEPGIWMASEYYGGSKQDSDAISYMFFEKKGVQPTGANPALKRLGALIGHVILEKDWRKGYHVQDLASDRPGFAARIAIHVLRDLGLTQDDLVPPAAATQEGKVIYAWAARNTKWKGVFDYYVLDKRSNEWFSPNHIRQMAGFWSQELGKSKVGQSEYPLATISKELQRYSKLYDQVSKEAWNDPRLEEMFSLKKNLMVDGVQGSMIREGSRAQEGQLMQSLGTPNEASTQDMWTASQMQAQFNSQAQRALEHGMSFDQAAPETLLSYGSRKMWEKLTGYGHARDIDRVVGSRTTNETFHEMDRIGKFTKVWWTLDQLTWRNLHIVGLKMYRELTEKMKQLGAFWLNKADETARYWEKNVTDPKERDAVAQALFMLTEMNYRLPNEVLNKIIRLPSNWGQFLAGNPVVPGGELDRLFKRAGVKTAEGLNVIRMVANDFAAFLNQVEQVRDKLLVKRHGVTSTAYATAKAALTKEMNDLREKPYFPMVRFGEFTLALRDPNNNNKLVYANAYMTQSQRDAAAREALRQYPGTDLTIGRVDPRMSELMSLPGPLIRSIKELLLDKMGLSKADEAKMEALLEEFEAHHAPDRSFRRRWMPAKGIPGYSMDALRTYAHYFMYGSRYIARLAYMDDLQSAINQVNNTVTSPGVKDTAKRQAIVKYMKDHFDYMMEGGRDGGKFRAFMALWMLGFSPAAAAMNLTQPYMVLWPKLVADFGFGDGNAVLSQGLNALKATNGYAVGDPRFEMARGEMVRQGYIEVGQAAELGAFAEGYNLMKLFSGTKAQKAWRGLQWGGMKMFSAIEHFNRELTFKVAYDLGLKYAATNNKAMQLIDLTSPQEAADLRARLGMTQQEALAFLYAKDAIKRTQFEYGKDQDAPFMRNPLAKNFLIFFKYTHSMLYAIRFNGAMFQMLALMAFMYGLQGLPGSDEANELLRLLMRKLFGADFDLQGKAREFARAVTRGTIFDEVGPDLLMHGISRYGFGLGLLPEGWGAPRFDASANGSMGRIVPGLAEMLHGINTDQKWNDMVAQSAQRAAGAGYGQVMSMMQFMMAPNQVDSHKWEQLLPRFMKGWAAAYRYGVDPQAETTAAGAQIAKFNPTDPDDLTTIAAQALGFRPTKVNEKWEMIRAAREVTQTYTARKADLYIQFQTAMVKKDPEALQDVANAIKAFNDQVAKEYPTLVISTQSLRNSIHQRLTSKGLMEEFLATSKKDILVTQKIMDLYPGVRVEKVK